MFSYLRRHWRGELPLAVAWWINGVALTALSVALEFNAARLGLGAALDTRLRFIVYVVVGVGLLLVVPAWQLVGIFRAADRHGAEVGTLFTAYLTQALTTVLSILLAMRFLVFASEVYSGARIALPAAGRGYTVTVGAGGRLLEVDGGIVFGLARDVRRALAEHPRVRRLRLNSGGGALSEAVKLRGIVLAAGLDTDSTGGCSSACVSVYVAGRHRLLRRSARLGFHLPRNPGFGLHGTLSPDYAAEIGYFAARGLPLWFIERWIATGRRFWYPTPAELRQSGLVQTFMGPPRPGEELYFLAGLDRADRPGG